MTCIHEAAHAVISFILFAESVTYVSVIPDPSKDEAGRTNIIECEYLPEHSLRAGFAGMHAQSLWTDAPRNAGCSDDFTKIQIILDRLSPYMDQPARVKLRARVREESLAMVIANEVAIRRVAEYLLEHGEIGQIDDYGKSAKEVLARLIDERRLSIP